MEIAPSYTRLRPPPINGTKRSGVVRSDDGYFSGPRPRPPRREGAFVRLRVESPEVGFRHTVIDERGAIIATSSGKTDADTWTRGAQRGGTPGVRSRVVPQSVHPSVKDDALSSEGLAWCGVFLVQGQCEARRSTWGYVNSRSCRSGD